MSSCTLCQWVLCVGVGPPGLTRMTASKSRPEKVHTSRWNEIRVSVYCTHGSCSGDWHLHPPHHCPCILAFTEESQEAAGRKDHSHCVFCMGLLCTESVHEVRAPALRPPAAVTMMPGNPTYPIETLHLAPVLIYFNGKRYIIQTGRRIVRSC